MGLVSTLFWVSLGFAVAGIAYDLITSRIALNRGFKEWNPIMAKFADPVLASGCVSLILLIGIFWAGQYEPVKATWFFLLFGLYRTACGVINTVRMGKARP